MSETSLIHVDGTTVSLVFERTAGMPPAWRHFGARRHDVEHAWPIAGVRPHPPTLLDGDPVLTVLPTHGFGWFQQPALAGGRPAGHGDLDWAHAFCLEDVCWEPHAIVFKLADKTAMLGLTISYAIDPESDVVSAWAELENRGDVPFRVDWLAAACVPLPADMDQVLGFTGRWTLEFQEARERLGVATWRRDNRRGRTSNDSFPGVIVGTALDDDTGAVLGAHLGWSGNHTILIEPLNDGRRQLQIGEWLAPGEVVLGYGERYRTPTAYLSFGTDGLNGLASHFHRFVRKRLLAWPHGRMKARPVHLNTWEAVYCNHDLDDLKSLADAAARLGIERFVLDDGWFHRRDHDRAGLGDWWPDARHYPHGLVPLVDHVQRLGMQFGLWVEPEMVNPDSDLYRAHPDWVLRLDGRPVVTGRHQLVLDLANAAVTDYLFDSLARLLSEQPIAYLKWDMNRDLAAAGHGGRAAYRRQTLAFYRLIGRVREAFPTVEIESCASGGSRADYGVLAHTHRIWTSDCNDALTRIDIQRGFLRFFPPEVMGAHIGPFHSHTTHRCHALAFRAAVALFGHLGIEMDVRTLPTEEAAELAYWIAVFKQWRHVVHEGVLRQGNLGDSLAWVQATSADGSASLVAVYRKREDTARYMPALPLKGLLDERRYLVRVLHQPAAPHFVKKTDLLTSLAGDGVVLTGATLRESGIPLPPMPPESATVISCRAV
ncbi:alpha-galactosidase [Trinickia fusca]|uniref:Alpha-galactosidase n=1 Tax=Trinickia fusca TaxID=2419777 RepID=A0A494X1H2_9BURK|nr:alpha-galactosidase [Trinickia fusca]RKP44170.1 alpha-galactosidase [Trinickia fusca]